ncbi:MAG: FG-GAP-like repeat-containing protein [Terriglobales bacterium]
MKLSRVAFLAVLILLAAGIFAAAPHRASEADAAAKAAEAARLNNIGVAYMNQQLFEKALKEFEAASAQDPSSMVARLNQGVALLNLQKVDEAKALLEDVVKQAPKDAHAWYNLGLFYKNTNETDAAVAAFRHVIEIDPNDADTWYFLGTVYAQAKQYPQAIDAFEHALKLNPLHASGEFGISRAYQQSGDTQKSREHLKKFQYIKDNKLGSPMSLAYGEQGQYSRAEESAGFLEKVPAAIPVKFVDVTAEAGIKGQGTGNAPKLLSDFLGAGACFLDYDGDGRIDLFVADGGPGGGMALYHNLGGGKFEDVTKKAGLDPTLHGIGCTAGDYDNDGSTDLAVTAIEESKQRFGRVFLLHNEKSGVFRDVTQNSGIQQHGLSMGLAFVDYDHDGDLDLSVTQHIDASIDSGQGGSRPLATIAYLDGTPTLGWMYRNNGDGSFTEVAESIGLNDGATANGAIGVVGTDYNNDRAVDLVVSDHGPRIFENPREGKFIQRKPWSGQMPAPVIGLAVLDFNHDGWMDISFTHMGEPGSTLWQNNKAKSFDRVDLPTTSWVRAFGVAAIDYDNDGWVDLVAVGETKDGKGAVRLFRNLGPDGFKDVTADVGLDKIQLKDPRAIITGDYDNDGAVDLLITQNHGPAVLVRNEGGNKNNWLRLNLKGLNDNKSAIGTKVEVFAGANRQKFEIYGSSGYLGQNSPYLTVGLGQAKQADVVRMLWPTGVLQDEIEVAGNREVPYLELDRRGSSCPTLFVWDGRHYELVGDMIGAGVVGHWVGPHERNVPRPAEYIKVDRNTIHLKDGKLSFRLMEPMEEAVYLDEVKLFAVDHPSGFEVFPNEYFASNPPFPAFRVIQSRGVHLPAAARDEHGHDLMPALRAHKYSGDFELLPFHGFTKPHSLELDLGEPYRGGPLVLLMHGETEYFTATSVYAAHQAQVEAIAPYVEALDAHGNWVRVVDDMGFPAGGPRTITPDLTGKLPMGTRRIRITTNLQVYWDSILVDRSAQDDRVGLTPVPLASAKLDFYGHPRQIEGEPRGNVKYVYEEVSPTGPFARQAGDYTRYGDVLPLLRSFDDRFVVFGTGDEIALEFDPAKLPALPAGWTRDYFFLVNGYEKDMDFYAADGFTVEPLPFRAMGGYPYPGKRYPLDREHLDYLLEYNTRHVSGNESTGYSYQYPETKSQKH